MEAEDFLAVRLVTALCAISFALCGDCMLGFSRCFEMQIGPHGLFSRMSDYWEDEVMMYAEEFYEEEYFMNMLSTFGIVRLEDCWARIEFDNYTHKLFFIGHCYCITPFVGPYFEIVLVVEEIFFFI